MQIEKLSVDNLRTGVFCWSGKPHADETYDQLEAWLTGDRLRGQIARNARGEPVGFILYYPIEQAPMDVEGKNLYMVQCVYVKPEYCNQGVGKALVESAIADAKAQGATGIAVEGFKSKENSDRIPDTFFQHLGLEPADTRGAATLYYTSSEGSTPPPSYLSRRFNPPDDATRVRIDILDCRKCYVGITNREVVKTVSERFKDKVYVEIHDQSTREAIMDKGMANGIFFDGKLTFFEGPVSEADVINAINVAESARRQQTDR